MKTLSELYRKEENKIISVREHFLSEDLEGPLLLDLKEYYEQPIKLLIIGQETFGWDCNYNNQDSLLKTYRDFHLGEHYKSTPFWNIIRKLEKLTGIATYGCAWTNLNRFDYNGEEPKDDILNKIEELDYLVKQEIAILKPDICFFMTNRKYDYRHKKLFPDLEMAPIEGLPYNHFVKLTHNDIPSYSFRTPHPKTIRIQKWEEAFFRVMERILPNKKSE